MMKKLILVAALFMSATVRAEITPEDVFGTIFDIIQTQIEKDKQNQNGGNNNWQNNNGWQDNSWKGNKVLLKDVGDKIILGRVFIDERGADRFDLPRCNQSKNQRVNRLRLVVNEADVYIDRVRVVFQNGSAQVIDVDDVFEDGERTRWIDLKGAADRCIKTVRITGEVLQKQPNWGGGFGPGNGAFNPFGPGIGKPKPGKGPFKPFKETAVINVVGQKF